MYSIYDIRVYIMYPDNTILYVKNKNTISHTFSRFQISK